MNGMREALEECRSALHEADCVSGLIQNGKRVPRGMTEDLRNHVRKLAAFVTALSAPPAPNMTLFQRGDFTLASGQKSNWKIECDALTEDDWKTLAAMIAKKYSYCEVCGVPRGGLYLAELLRPHCISYVKNSLIVDDVYTTGGSMRRTRDELIQRPDGGGKNYLGCVIFSRTPCMNEADNWITPMFRLSEWW